MGFKTDLNISLHPKKFLELINVNANTGIKLMAAYSLVLILINVIFATINGIIDGKSIGGVIAFSGLTSVSIAFIAVISLLIIAVVGTWLSQLFHGQNNIQKTIGLVSYAIVPIFIISLIQNILILISTIGNHFLTSAYTWINLALLIITFIWIAVLSIKALAVANQIQAPAIACFILGFIVVLIINIPISFILVKLSAGILNIGGVF